LTVAGGTAVLSGASTFTGGLTITGGAVSVAADANMGAAGSPVNLNGGTLSTTAGFTLAAARFINVGAAGGTINVIGTGTTGKVATAGLGQLVGTGPLTKTGGADFQFVSDNLGYSGNFIVAGLVEASSSRALGTG
ncbi:hypothetical protein I6F37_42305, partial [Bradyrhizobium sp. NBAIM08]|nr:hypothetical protein [Bradyrhizobium sp. NBAIM08]